jgi:hypothetical protein
VSATEPGQFADYGRAWNDLRKRLQDRYVMAREVLEAEGMGDVAALIPIEEVLIWMAEEEDRTDG